jgi:excisionase family DNA binding protein
MSARPQLAFAPAPTGHPSAVSGALALLSVNSCAKQWALSPSVVRKWIRTGALPHYRLGRRVLISAADADAFLAAHRMGGQP